MDTTKAEGRKECARVIYENNRPKFHDWGTLKEMCIYSMLEFSDEETNCLRQENELLKKLLTEGINIHWENYGNPAATHFKLEKWAIKIEEAQRLLEQ